MKNIKKNYSLTLALITSVGSIIILFLFSLEKSGIFWKESINWNRVEPILIILIPFFVAMLSLLFSMKLKKRERTIFIIYSHKDKSQADNIRKELSRMGMRVFMDEQVIRIGDNIKETLERNIKSSTKIIIVLSKNTEKSEWINKEIKLAKELNKNIFPVVIEDKVSLPEPLKGIKYADLTKINKETIKPLYNAVRN